MHRHTSMQWYDYLNFFNQWQPSRPAENSKRWCCWLKEEISKSDYKSVIFVKNLICSRNLTTMLANMDTQPNKIENTKWTAATTVPRRPRRPPQPPPLCRERFIHLQFCLDYNLDFSSRDAQIRSSRILNLIFCPTNIMETTNLKAVALKELWHCPRIRHL